MSYKPFQKKLIEEIIDSEIFDYNTFIYKHFNLLINGEETKLDIEILQTGEYVGLITVKNIQDSYQKLIDFLTLLESLRNLKLIYTKEDISENVIPLTGDYGNDRDDRLKFIINSLLEKNMYYYGTKELSEFRNREYLTLEEIHNKSLETHNKRIEDSYKRHLCWTKVIAIAAVLAVLASAIFNLLALNRDSNINIELPKDTTKIIIIDTLKN